LKIPVIVKIGSILIGAVFLLSGTLKSLDVGYFAYSFNMYQLEGLKFLAPIIVIVEVYIGLHLILLTHIRQMSLIGLLLLVSFTGVLLYGFFSFDIENCYCFGREASTGSSGIKFSIFRNILMIALLIFLIYKSNRETIQEYSWKRLAITFFTAVAIFIAGMTSGIDINISREAKAPEFDTEKLEYLKKFYPISNDTLTFVCIFSYSCPYCLNSIANINSMVSSKLVGNVVGFAFGTPAEREIFEENYDPLFDIVDISNEKIKDLTISVPYSVFVKDGEILLDIRGLVPSHYFIKKELEMLEIKQNL
jgi:hypothetical protein